MTQPRVNARIELSGEFFRIDPAKRVGENITRMLEALAEEAESQVQAAIEQRSGSMPYYTGWTAEHVVGRVEAISGKDWHRHMVVSANTAGLNRKDAIRTLAAASYIEGRWHPFRRVGSAVRRFRSVVQADLAKGLG